MNIMMGGEQDRAADEGQWSTREHINCVGAVL